LANVLIVDDDAETAGALREVMNLEGHETRVAYNGRQGLAALKVSIPDVVLLDVEMPVLAGPDMAIEMFLHDLGLESIPIVLISGVPNLAESAAKIGTPYMLSKPFRYENLVAVINTALREHRAPVPPEAR